MGVKKFKTKHLFCLTGLPLAGKSYVGQLLASRVAEAIHISTGDIARSLIKTAEQQKAMEAKDLFQGEEELREELKKQIDATAATCVLVDGCPRFADQAKWIADTFHDLFPTVIDVQTGDLATLVTRARQRARDTRDTNQAEFATRLELAMKNQSEVFTVLTSRLIPCYTIVGTADDASIYKQFHHITKNRL